MAVCRNLRDPFGVCAPPCLKVADWFNPFESPGFPPAGRPYRRGPPCIKRFRPLMVRSFVTRNSTCKGMSTRSVHLKIVEGLGSYVPGTCKLYLTTPLIKRSAVTPVPSNREGVVGCTNIKRSCRYGQIVRYRNSTCKGVSTRSVHLKIVEGLGSYVPGTCKLYLTTPLIKRSAVTPVPSNRERVVGCTNISFLPLW